MERREHNHREDAVNMCNYKGHPVTDIQIQRA